MIRTCVACVYDSKLGVVVEKYENPKFDSNNEKGIRRDYV